MVAQNKVVTAQGINTSQAVCTAAKTTTNDLTNAVAAFTAGASGAVVYRITATARGPVAGATGLQLYRSPDGVAASLIRLALMPIWAGPLASTIPAFGTAPFGDVIDFGYSESVPLRVKPLGQLWAGIGVALAAGIVFDVQGEDL